MVDTLQKSGTMSFPQAKGKLSQNMVMIMNII